jgi:hypothetical protein
MLKHQTRKEDEMPTRKATTKSARKTSAKATSKGKAVDLQAIKAGRMEMYGPPIRDAIRRGDLNEMKELATLARTHIKEVEAALAQLEKALVR